MWLTKIDRYLLGFVMKISDRHPYHVYIGRPPRPIACVVKASDSQVVISSECVFCICGLGLVLPRFHVEYQELPSKKFVCSCSISMFSKIFELIQAVKHIQMSNSENL